MHLGCIVPSVCSRVSSTSGTGAQCTDRWNCICHQVPLLATWRSAGIFFSHASKIHFDIVCRRQSPGNQTCQSVSRLYVSVGVNTKQSNQQQEAFKVLVYVCTLVCCTVLVIARACEFAACMHASLCSCLRAFL